VEVSAPVTDGHWQLLRFAIVAARDNEALSAWDHRSGDPTFVRENQICGVNVPADDGLQYLGQLGLWTGELVPNLIPLPEDVLSGSWTRILLQLFPDGRCGVGVNGRALAVTTNRIRAGRPFRVVLAGNSANTRMLVGQLRIWEGVQPDVAWDFAQDGGR
jgi:hypothetical protein